MPFERSYRRLHTAADLTYFSVKVKETDLHIGALRELPREALRAIQECRDVLEDYIASHAGFQGALSPVPCESDAPIIIKKMCAAAEKAGVGPMAAVAGAVAEHVGIHLLQYSEEVIVENGGDIFLAGKKERTIAIFAGPSPLSNKAGVRITPDMLPLGVCTSAGTFGHSLSFGKADAAMILARDAALADACATQLGNMIKDAGSLQYAIETIAKVEGVMGALGIIGDRMAAWGEIELIPL
jgi:uncharacterized protein